MENIPFSTGPTNSIRLPEPQDLFNRRATRLRQLASGQNALSGYLALMADLADIQHCLAKEFPRLILPDSSPGKPPLDVGNCRPDLAWRGALRRIAEWLDPAGEPLATVCKQILEASDEAIDAWAGRLLAMETEPGDPGLAPFVAAALQINWATQAGQLTHKDLGLTDPRYACPVCGFLPVAGVLQTGGAIPGLRYLCCGLCASEWNLPRIQCAHCGGSKNLACFSLEGEGRAVKAEACADCKTYTKLLDREKIPLLDPCADDLASLALDVLLAEEGYRRLGCNPLFTLGGEDAA